MRLLCQAGVEGKVMGGRGKISASKMVKNEGMKQEIILI